MSLATGTIWFPAWCIKFSEKVQDPRQLAATIVEQRPNDGWALLAYDAAASEAHLWTAWLAMVQRQRNDSMRSHSRDAEFLRLIAGTRQVSVAFERAGLAAGDEKCWLVHLPPPTRDDAELPTYEGDLPTVIRTEIEAVADSLMGWLGAELIARRPVPTAAGLLRLGIIEATDSESTPPPQDWEALFLGHIAVADL